MLPRTLREEMEEREQEILSPYAALNKNTKGRQRAEEECPIRTAFQRDRDRIIHSKTFRRLKHKTQVFLAPTGDHYRTRLTHVLEVAQIARTITKALHLNEDLAEAIALAHDLGHTPFGHAGEKVLNEVQPGGFNHHEQSLRVVELLEKKGQGLNLTWEVRDGILRHSKGKNRILPADTKDLPSTLEGRIVRVADLIAYVNHDLDDAIRAGVIKQNDIPDSITRTLGESHSARTGVMIRDLVEKTLKADNGALTMSDEVMEGMVGMRAFLYRNVYESSMVHADFVKAMKVLRELYEYFLANDDSWETDIIYDSETPRERKVCDFIAGMTDRYALNIYTARFLPKPWSIL